MWRENLAVIPFHAVKEVLDDTCDINPKELPKPEFEGREGRQDICAPVTVGWRSDLSTIWKLRHVQTLSKTRRVWSGKLFFASTSRTSSICGFVSARRLCLSQSVMICSLSSAPRVGISRKRDFELSVRRVWRMSYSCVKVDTIIRTWIRNSNCWFAHALITYVHCPND